MIQRLQTLYFLGALILMVLMLFLPIVRFIGPGGEVYHLVANGIKTTEAGNTSVVLPAIPLIILLLVIPCITVFTIVSFKKRIHQVRLSVFNILLMAGSLILAGYYLRQGVTRLNTESYLLVPLVFPLVSALSTYLGLRRVRKDEEMVRSYDRIR